MYYEKEFEMRDADVPWFDTIDELKEYINSLTEQDHDYGTAVYAISMAATATFKYVAKQLGCTGFQASCADMDILRRTRHMKNGFSIINYENLLYPQYKISFPTWDQLIEDNLENLAEDAAKKLKDSPGAHKDVRAHWEKLVEMQKNSERSS